MVTSPAGAINRAPPQLSQQPGGGNAGAQFGAQPVYKSINKSAELRPTLIPFLTPADKVL